MAAPLFCRQFNALFAKNWIVLAKHPLVNLLRCLIMPIAVAIFLAYAQVFLSRPNSNGLGTFVPIFPLADVYDPAWTFVWSDNTNGTTNPSPKDIMARVLGGFSGKQLGSVRQVGEDEIASTCLQNFLGTSNCFAAVSFEGIPAAGVNQTLNYTIRYDSSLGFVDVKNHKSDFERRILPLQWAIDSSIIELETGVTPATPLEWPFTLSTDEEEYDSIRLAYVGFVGSLLVLPFFICYVGISYQLPGSATTERALGITSHMKAMGLLDSARVLSWHLSLSLAYFPAWIIIAVIWQVKVFSGTSVGLMIAIHLLTGLSLASWAMFVMAPFGKSPTLAAIVSTVLTLALVVIAMVYTAVPTFTASIITLFFPPFFYPVAIRCVSGFEVNLVPTSALVPDPEYGLTLWPLLLATLLGIFLWPMAGALWERMAFDARNPPHSTGCCGRRGKHAKPAPPPPGTAISIRNLGKDFRTPFSFFGRKGSKKGVVTAISDLAGKSTAMSILGGLTGRTRGEVVFEGGVERPPRGSIGLVPQKNVLFPELTCFQTLRLWSAVKPRFDDSADGEDIVQILHDCDLANKVHYNAGALSGGQKRKLQLAIGLVGGSKIVLVDECTSGVDPLSRRAIWKTLSSVRGERTIVFTTHFLDEADLLADEIAVLAAPGRLVAHGSPVKLKSTLGEGYTMKVTYQVLSENILAASSGLLKAIRSIAPDAYTSVAGPAEVSFHLKTSDPEIVRQVLQIVEKEKSRYRIASYAVSATSIEDIFLDLMQAAEAQNADKDDDDDEIQEAPGVPGLPSGKLELTTGSQRSILGQALTIFHKRALVARRSWLSLLLALAVALIAPTVTLQYLPAEQAACAVQTSTDPPAPLFLPSAFPRSARPLVAPPTVLSALGPAMAAVRTRPLADNASFVGEVSHRFWMDDVMYGGVSVDVQDGAALFAWDAEYGATGQVFLNAVSNLLYNRALNDTGAGTGTPRLITPSYGFFSTISAGSLTPLKWAAFFGAAMAVFPAFFALYVAQERRSSVQAMQFSNGLSNPAGLWLGHLMFDSIFSLVAATILVIIFAAKSTLFTGLGYLWFVMVLYGITGTLFAYCVSLVLTNSLAAFAVLAAYQVVIFGLYLAAYLLVLTYAKSTEAIKDMNTIHFTMSLISPVPNVLRAAFVSINMFNLLCKGDSPITTSSLGSITHYGGPILYLILSSILLFAILVYADSGSLWKQKLLSSTRLPNKSSPSPAIAMVAPKPDVLAEATAVRSPSSTDALRVLDVSKSFGRGDAPVVVDGVSFGVAHDTIFALLGPNGAGKTTTLNMVRGDLAPDAGDVRVNGHSVVRHTRAARHALGVCPQFTAIDAQLTVREHLSVYARLKGLGRGEETRRDIDAIMVASGLWRYRDRLASKLSGGNQRKLALAIALIGNPSVILIDEFSTGVDAKMKRDMWRTLKNVAVGKAIVITTHSMEEASTLANKVGIIAKRMLAVGTTDELVERYGRYLVHFPCRTREDVVRARTLMAHIPRARMADDVATRFEVPIGDGMSLAELFGILAEAGAREYAVEKASLESVFMKVIRENEVEEGDGEAVARTRSWWRVW
ncbi:ATP-binding cassette transporter [Ganoderma sinense ZZ0214-1]|uniref:ATP-binding cassette transporter n=1 Tax=Ganoderma sinense ZZ0214-1 TaxID=1077348 RepID=A0A2G8SBR7_9APHY|nr:ATP-binding cassette transporter [Ganoderma sinense ZZ0214-1]